MPLEQVIANFTGTGFATTPPVIPGVAALGFFGSAFGGNNGNRVAGGPAFGNLTQAPDIGSAWITVNGGTQTPTKGLDTGVVETLAVQQAGWTIFTVARMLGAGSATLFGVGFTGLTLTPSSAFASNHPAIFHQQQAFAFDAATALIDLGAGTAVNAWRMYALGYTAGTTNRPYKVYDVTGNQENTTNNAGLRSANSHFDFGQPGAAVPNGYGAADEACSGICTQLLTLAQLRTVRTWLLGVESMRFVTGF